MGGRLSRLASCLSPGGFGGVSAGDGRFWQCGGQNIGIFQAQRRKGVVVLETGVGSRGNRFEEM